MRPAKKIPAFKDSKSITEWLDDDRCKVGRTTLTKRLKEGMDPEEAMTAGRQSGKAPADPIPIHRVTARLPGDLYLALDQADTAGAVPGGAARGGRVRGSRAGAIRAGLDILASDAMARARIERSARRGGPCIGEAAHIPVDVKLTGEEFATLQAIAAERGVGDPDVLRAAALELLRSKGLDQGISPGSCSVDSEVVTIYLEAEEMGRLSEAALDQDVFMAEVLRASIYAMVDRGGPEASPGRKQPPRRDRRRAIVTLDPARIEALDTIATRLDSSRSALIRAALNESQKRKAGR